MNSIFEELLKTDYEEPDDDVLSDNEITEDEEEDDEVCVPQSSLEDFSDSEISTEKERHWRLGPGDLNDTLPYEFPASEAVVEQEADEQTEPGI